LEYIYYNQFSVMDNYMCFKERLEETGNWRKISKM